ncbi:MAG: adenine deaminase [Pirellulales bacterium]|nr:adenine deaminase [Pirellulales bacterium]
MNSHGPTITTVSGQLVDIFNQKIFPGTVHLVGGRISRIEESASAPESLILPGFVDAHIHIESSMLVPTEFARLAVVHGTVATISDPHEIANVLGTRGIWYMIDNAKLSPVKFHFGASSCVPACAFDKSGAVLDAAEVAKLLDDPEIKYLTEMMNFPGVLQCDPEVMAKIRAAHERTKPVDGHAPGLCGEGLRKYAAAGITTDHESFTYREAREKIGLGIKCLIREGSAAKNFAALYPLLGEFPEMTMLCSDDKHPDDLVVGHINQLVVRAVAHGQPLFAVLRAACVNPVLHYGLDVGLLRPGDAADFIEVGNLEQFPVLRTVINGQVVAERGRTLLKHVAPPMVNQFKTSKLSAEEFAIPHPPFSTPHSPKLRVIEAIDGQIVTGQLRAFPKIENGLVVSDVANDILKIVLVDRYNDSPPAIGFIKNFGLTNGAIASTVSHDSHNLLAVGVEDESIAQAINLLIDCRGGISAVGKVNGEKTETVLPLPIAGLMSDREGHHVGQEYARIDKLAKALGSQLSAPYMTLSFMALLVIPELKLGPCGVFDVGKFQPMALWD